MVIPAWLQDVTRAAQLLTRLSLETAAQASLILKDGSLYAYAGELPQQAVEELAGAAAHHWQAGGGKDLARFIRLDSIHGEYMVYTTRLANGMALSVAYSIETPFSKIRSQASRLARALSSPPNEEALAAPVIQKVEAPRLETPVDAEEREIPLPPLFDNVPPPSPATFTRPIERADWIPEESSAPPTIPASRPAAAPVSGILPAHEQTDPAAPVQSSLFLSFTLVTRLPRQPVSAHMQAALENWMTNLNLAFGWRLEKLSCGVEYMAWVNHVSPVVAPARIANTIRTHTSRLIFAEYPGLKTGNPSGDFWAPGYMVTGSSLPAAPESIAGYLAQVRRAQGIWQSQLEE